MGAIETKNPPLIVHQCVFKKELKVAVNTLHTRISIPSVVITLVYVLNLPHIFSGESKYNWTAGGLAKRTTDWTNWYIRLPFPVLHTVYKSIYVLYKSLLHVPPRQMNFLFFFKLIYEWKKCFLLRHFFTWKPTIPYWNQSKIESKIYKYLMSLSLLYLDITVYW